MAIGHEDWTPSDHGPRLHLVRMSETSLRADIEQARIENVDVPMFSVPRTLVDCFRFRKLVGINVAMEALREALRLRKALPFAHCRNCPHTRCMSLVSPYLEAFTLDD